MNTVSQQRPISPQKLLQRLLNDQYKQSECIDESARVKNERQILAQLVIEYRHQLNLKSSLIVEIESLIEVRAKLRLQLQNLRNSRKAIDKRLSDQIYAFRLTPVQIRENSQIREEIDQLRDKNCKMGVRLQQMLDYQQKLQRKVSSIEQEYKMMQIGQDNAAYQLRQTQNRIQEMNWRDKIKALKQQQQAYSSELRQQIRVRQQKGLNQARVEHAMKILNHKAHHPSYQNLRKYRF